MFERDFEIKKKFEELLGELPEPDTEKAWCLVMRKKRNRFYKSSAFAIVLIVSLALTISFAPGPVKAFTQFIRSISVEWIGETVKLYQRGDQADVVRNNQDFELHDPDIIVLNDIDDLLGIIDDRFIVPEGIESNSFTQAEIQKAGDNILLIEIHFML